MPALYFTVGVVERSKASFYQQFLTVTDVNISGIERFDFSSEQIVGNAVLFIYVSCHTFDTGSRKSSVSIKLVM